MKTPSSPPRGFAIVVTLTLMVLLSILALGLLSLSSIALRSTATSTADATARSNARMALMIAISELQKHAGSDQRVTARADLLDKDSANPMWTAVWNSRGGEPAYLVSGNELSNIDLGSKPSSPPVGYYKPETALSEKGSVALFENPNDKKQNVRAALVKLSGPQQGAYAWWVADEGVKARFNTSNPYSKDGGFPDKRLAAVISQSNSTRLASDDLRNKWPLGNEKADRAVTLAQGQLVATTAKDFPKTYFHSLTAYSRGLLVDVKNGGLKRDLTQAFENDNVFQRWFGAMPVNQTINGGANHLGTGEAKIMVSGFNPDTAPEKFFISNKFFLKTKKTGPNWGTLRYFHRLFESNASGTADIVFPYPSVNAQMRKNTWNPYTDYQEGTNAFANDSQHTNNFLSPVMARVQMGYRLRTEPVPGSNPPMHRAVVEFKPLFGLWNPYNVTFKANTYRIDWEMSPVFDITIDGKTYKIKLNDWYGDTSDSEFIRLVVSPLADLQPGEYRMFSLDSPVRLKSAGFRKNAGATISVGPKWGENGAAEMILPIIEAKPGAFREWQFPAGSSVKVNKVSLSEGTHGAFGDAASAGNFLTLKPGASGKDQSNVSNFRTTNFWQPGVSGITPEEVEDLPPMNSTTLLSSPEPIATWSFSLRSTVVGQKPGQPKQAIRNLIDSNLRACVANSRWDGSVNGTGMTCISSFIGDGPNGRGKLQGNGEPVADTTGNRYRMKNGDLSQTHIVAFDVPQAPPLSLGSYQHATLARYNYEPSFVVGNSYANPRITLDKDINMNFLGSSGTIPLAVHDTSRIINEALFDTYFLSGLSPDAGRLSPAAFKEMASGKKPAPNSRVTFLIPGAEKTVYIAPDDPKTTDELPGKIAIEGAFNVNSTSVAAWRAVLAGMADQEVPTFDAVSNGATSWGNTGGVSFPRFTRIPGDKDDFWKGYFSLTDDQLDKLAVEIVNQVRARGPFRSMGDFVNRSLVKSTNPKALIERDIRESGALQAALDSNYAGINAKIPAGVSEDATNLSGDFQPILDGYPQATGNAGYLLQGDILQALAPQLTVRSDTFTIRAYGEARNKNGGVTARAWCEAVVQRVPDPYDLSLPPAASPVTFDAPSPLTHPGGPFGRKFILESFRWLSHQEI